MHPAWDAADLIVVDSSVWIANLRQIDCEPVRKLDAIPTPSDILVGDLVMLEVLQGARDDRHAAQIEAHLREFNVVSMLGESLASQAASHSRHLRRHAVTVRKTIDVIIATFCIANGHVLLHDDRDFVPFVEYLGLQVL